MCKVVGDVVVMFYEVFFECIEISNDSLGILVGDVGSIE